MKKQIMMLSMLLHTVFLIGCARPATPKSVPKTFSKPQDIQEYLLEQNASYLATNANTGDLSADKRADTAANGQQPYAVVVTCSDSRVPAEHIFNAGIGELFVIRTAGNVIGDYELGSVEYGAAHLGARLVVVLGHTHCGAVNAALHGKAHGYMKTITDEISSCLPENCGLREAERLNIKNSIHRILSSEIMQKLTESGKVNVVGAIYDIESGAVSFFN